LGGVLALPSVAVGQSNGIASSTDIQVVTSALNSLKSGHPRLSLNAALIQQLKNPSSRSAAFRSSWTYFYNSYAAQLAIPPNYYSSSGLTLDGSRTCSLRVRSYALLYLATGESRFLQRLIREFETACAYPAWGGTGTLQLAEMTYGIATAYDWSYASIPTSVRTLVEQAIVNKGLIPGLAIYGSTANWWETGLYNYNMVISGGLGVAALAIADIDKPLAIQVLANARASLSPFIASYFPDGGYPEGYDYWTYTMNYYAQFMDALQSSGVNLSLPTSTGIASTGDIKLYNGSTNSDPFNYGDCSGYYNTPYMFWLSTMYNRPEYAEVQRASLPYVDVRPTDIVWWSDSGKTTDVTKNGSTKQFYHANVAYLASTWVTPRIKVGFKGGFNSDSHMHLDLGTFVMDALGQRWALSLGAENYSVAGEFDPIGRWLIYRNATIGQNTLMFSGLNQSTSATATLTVNAQNGSRPFAIMNGASTTPTVMSTWNRGMIVVDNLYSEVQDEFTPTVSGTEIWAMHTTAHIAISGSTATLTQGGQTMKLYVLSPSGATWSTASAQPGANPAGQTANTGVTRLVLQFAGHAGSAARITVAMVPQASGAPSVTSLLNQPLSGWTSFVAAP
jgi:hypothetical protein